MIEIIYAIGGLFLLVFACGAILLALMTAIDLFNHVCGKRWDK